MQDKPKFIFNHGTGKFEGLTPEDDVKIEDLKKAKAAADINKFVKSTLPPDEPADVNTINKTLKSYLFAIIGAEYILKWLPIGTHDWDKFVKPNQLREIAKQNSLKFNKLDGVKLDLLLNKWKLSKDSSVNYISNFIKT